MSDNVLRFDFLAVDHFSPVAERVKHKLDGVGERLGAVGKVAAFALGGVAVTAVAAFGYEMVKGVQSAVGYQTLLLKTAAVIKSTGNAAHISVDGVKELADSLAQTSGVQDELIINSENVLATFTAVRNETGKGNDIFNQATGSILDMSVALGEDMQSATIQVGKALQDPVKGVTALRRVGVMLTDQQQAQIKVMIAHGNVMGAQKIILHELSKEFGGAAKAAGSGLGGALGRVKLAIEDTFRSLALSLLPVLTKAANWLADKLPGAIMFAGNAFKMLGGWLIQIGKAIAIPIFKLYVTYYTLLGRAVLYIIKTVGPPALQFFRLLVQYFRQTVPVVVQVAKVIGGVLAAGVQVVAHYFSDMLLPALRDAATKIFPALKGAVASITSAFADHMDVIQAFGQVFMFILKALGVALAVIAVLLVKVVIPVIAELLTIVLAVVGPIVRVLLSVTGILITVVKSLASFAVQVVTVMLAVARAIVMPFVDSAKMLYNAGRLIIGGLILGITSAFRLVSAAISAVSNFITGPFKNAAAWLLNAGLTIISGLIHGVTVAWPHILIAMGHTIDILLGPWRSAITWLVKAGQFIIDGLIKGFKSVYQTVVVTIGGFIHDKIIGPFVSSVGWLFGHGRDVFVGLWRGISSFVSTIAHGIASFVHDKIVGPFVSSVGWLVGHGRDVFVGLWRGMLSFFGTVSSAIGGFISSKIKGPFLSAVGWLKGAGAAIISGLLNGITGAIKNVGTWINDHVVQPIIAAVRWFFGISSPSTVMMGLGVHLMAGLFKGMMKHGLGGMIKKIFGGMPQALGAMVSKGLQAIEGLPKKALDALGAVYGFIAPGGAIGTYGQGVMQWAPLIRQALAMNGLSQSLLPRVLAQMQTESGGDVNAINLWDSNAKAGTPSKGLMQVIQPTFAAYHMPGTSLNIYDPLANIAAALNYAKHAYGPALSALGHGHGYDAGGMLTGRGLFGKWTSAPERVLSPAQTRWFERAMAQSVRTPARGSASLEMHWHFDNYAGNADDLVRVLTKAARRGQLDPIIRLAGGK